MKTNGSSSAWTSAVVSFLCCIIALPVGAEEQESLTIDMNEMLRRATESGAQLKERYDNDPAYRARVDADKLSDDGKYAEAIEIYRSLLQETKDDQSLYMRMGIALFSTGQPAESIPLFEEAIAHNTRGKVWNWYPQMYKGYAFLQTARLNKAVDAFSESIDLNPTETQLYTARARALFGLGKYDDAIRDMDRAIERRPNSHEFWTVKGAMIFEQIQRTHDDSNVEAGCAAAGEACNLGDCRLTLSPLVEEHCPLDLSGFFD